MSKETIKEAVGKRIIRKTATALCRLLTFAAGTISSPFERERKFLVLNDDWRSSVSSSHYCRQAYLSLDPGHVVRVREKDSAYYLTIKGKRIGISCPEFEYRIPSALASLLFWLSPYPVIEKNRHLICLHGHTWELDEFLGANLGLVVAELELQSESESFVRPAWLGAEVSEDKRYANARLVCEPFSRWQQ